VRHNSMDLMVWVWMWVLVLVLDRVVEKIWIVVDLKRVVVGDRFDRVDIGNKVGKVDKVDKVGRVGRVDRMMMDFVDEVRMKKK